MEFLAPFITRLNRQMSLKLDRIEEYKQTFCKLIANGDIKLIVFDLDNTLWHGAVGEGTAEPDEGKIGFIKQLVGAGVMCSIASYNHFDVAQDYLKALGIWDYFIFPQISNQGSKSSMIKNILEKTNLQAKHTIFVDDEFRNLAEARLAVEGLMVLLPDWVFCVAGPDLPQKSNTRLAEYKILEAKDKTKADYLTNEAFLESSQIQVNIGRNCQSHAQRIFELLSRTNQLNFTKQKLAEEELASVLVNDQKECGIVQVQDKFGDYGICGFFCLDKMEFKLEHFLFSCRVLGMKVENAVFKYLKTPKMDIVGPVANQNLEENSSFVSIFDLKEIVVKTSEQKSPDVVLKGGCQFTAMLPTLERYQRYTFALFENFVPLVPKGHTTALNQVDSIPPNLVEKFGKTLFAEHNIFQEWKFLVLAFAEDLGSYLWKIKGSDAKFVLGTVKEHQNLAHLKPLLSTEDLEWLEKNSEFIGLISEDDFFGNLTKLRSKLPQNTQLVVFNYRNPLPTDNESLTSRLNAFNSIIDRFVSLHNNVHLIDLRVLLSEKDLLIPGGLWHYKPYKNIELAESLLRVIEKCEKSN